MVPRGSFPAATPSAFRKGHTGRRDPASGGTMRSRRDFRDFSPRSPPPTPDVTSRSMRWPRATMHCRPSGDRGAEQNRQSRVGTFIIAEGPGSLRRGEFDQGKGSLSDAKRDDKKGAFRWRQWW